MNEPCHWWDTEPQSPRKLKRSGLVTRVRPVQGSPDKSVFMGEGHGQTRNPHQLHKLDKWGMWGDAQLTWAGTVNSWAWVESRAGWPVEMPTNQHFCEFLHLEWTKRKWSSKTAAVKSLFLKQLHNNEFSLFLVT